MNVLKLFLVLDIKLFSTICSGICFCYFPRKLFGTPRLVVYVHIRYRYSKIKKILNRLSQHLQSCCFFYGKHKFYIYWNPWEYHIPFIGMKLTFLCVKEFDSLTLLFFISDKKSIIILFIDYNQNQMILFDHS